jgi:uncharacterized protein (DUF2252 family)
MPRSPTPRGAQTRSRHPEPFEWEVKPLATSAAIAGRNNELSQAKIDRAARASVEGYRNMVSRLSTMGPLAVHNQRVEINEVRTLVEGNDKASARLSRVRRHDRARR